jgi:hypothetical protein
MFPQLKGVIRLVCSRRLPLIPFCQVTRGCEGSCQVQWSIVFLLSFNKEEQHATTFE